MAGHKHETRKRVKPPEGVELDWRVGYSPDGQTYGLKVFREDVRNEPGIMRPLYSNVNRGGGTLFHEEALKPTAHQYESGKRYNYEEMSTKKEHGGHTPPGYSLFKGTINPKTLNDVATILENIDSGDFGGADLVIKPTKGTEIYAPKNVKHSPRHGYFDEIDILEPEVRIPFQYKRDIEDKIEDRRIRRLDAEQNAERHGSIIDVIKKKHAKYRKKLNELYIEREKIMDALNEEDEGEYNFDTGTPSGYYQWLGKTYKGEELVDIDNESDRNKALIASLEQNEKEYHDVSVMDKDLSRLLIGFKHQKHDEMAKEYPEYIGDNHLNSDYTEYTEKPARDMSVSYMHPDHIRSILRKNAKNMKDPEVDPPSDIRLKEVK
jgi:hypothetical protein